MENHRNHRTWPSSSSSSPRFSSRPHLSSSHHSKKPKQKQQQQKQRNTQSPQNPNPDFSNLLPELLLKALSCAAARDLAAASGACRAWREALRPLREAALLHLWGRKSKHGTGHVRENRARAVEYFVKAARLGSAAAMVDAGLICWEEGKRKEAKEWYVKAAELGHPVGMCNLGLALLEADPPQAEEAVKWFYPSAIAGNARAQYNLGLCLQNGRGVKRNQREAAKWYLRAAEGGNIRAMYNTSLCYSSGEGLMQDGVRAKKWMQIAADCGHKKALYECGLKLCAAGNKVNSFIYLELATRRGETAASHMRDAILESLSLIDAQRALTAADRWKPMVLNHKK